MIRPVVLALVVLSAGCTTPGVYPSLAKRPIESRTDAVEATPVQPAKPDATLDARVKELTDQLAKADSDFAAAVIVADRAAKSPGAQAIGSDSWVAAQSSLADLDTAHDETLSVVTDAERLVTDRGVSGEPPYPSLDEARAKAQTQFDSQSQRLAAIKGLLGQK